MTSVFLAPHNDDETLFAAYTLLRERPRVFVVFRSAKQEAVGITWAERESETDAALQILGCAYSQWEYPDDVLASELRPFLEERLGRLAKTHETCFAPAVEEGGHEQHNLVGEAALAAFGASRVRPYLTYRRGYGKTVGDEVVPEPAEVAKKLRALACYESQIREPSCRPWFVGDLREYRPVVT